LKGGVAKKILVCNQVVSYIKPNLLLILRGEICVQNYYL
jgi:hypothetical protein